MKRRHARGVLLEVAIAGLGSGLITREELVQLLKSPCQDITVLEAAVLTGQAGYIGHFIKLMGKLYHSKLNGERILRAEDVDEVTALSHGAKLVAGNLILARYQALRLWQRLRL